MTDRTTHSAAPSAPQPDENEATRSYGIEGGIDRDLETETETETENGGSAWRWALPILVLLLAAGGAAALFNAREAPPRQERSNPGPLVETLEVAPADFDLTVRGHGEVGARIEVELLPEVPGKVLRVDDDLRSGGRFRAGEVLVRIDPRDYELAVERARAAVARAQTQLEQQEAEGEAARLEWVEMHADAAPPDLLVRGPQIRQAQAELAAAEADLATAELNLERTKLHLPFDGIVVEENVSPGQYVGAGRAVARVYGTAAVEVRVPLADGELAWFDLPRDGASPPAATVHAQIAGRAWTWDGVVERLEGQVDPRSRMVHVVVRIDRPFDAPSGVDTDDRPPLLPGSFVDVEIAGKTLADVVRLPRFALRDGGIVWAVEDEEPAGDVGSVTHAVRLREVEIVRADREHAYVRGLEAGDLVIVSALDAATDGMTVRLTSDLAGSADAAEGRS